MSNLYENEKIKFQKEKQEFNDNNNNKLKLLNSEKDSLSERLSKFLVTHNNNNNNNNNNKYFIIYFLRLNFNHNDIL